MQPCFQTTQLELQVTGAAQVSVWLHVAVKLRCRKMRALEVVVVIWYKGGIDSARVLGEGHLFCHRSFGLPSNLLAVEEFSKTDSYPPNLHRAARAARAASRCAHCMRGGLEREERVFSSDNQHGFENVGTLSNRGR